jgi:hypothetical protein
MAKALMNKSRGRIRVFVVMPLLIYIILKLGFPGCTPHLNDHLSSYQYLKIPGSLAIALVGGWLRRHGVGGLRGSVAVKIITPGEYVIFFAFFIIFFAFFDCSSCPRLPPMLLAKQPEMLCFLRQIFTAIMYWEFSAANRQIASIIAIRRLASSESGGGHVA